MAQSASIQKMSPRHEAILNFILANPTAKMGEVAAAFQVSPAWLSVVIHSDAFQNQLHRRHEEIFDTAVVAPVKTKLNAAVDLTLDRYLEKVTTFDSDQIIDASNKMLGRLGFGTSGGKGGTVINANNVQINNGHVQRDVLEEARSRIGAVSDQERDQVGSPDTQAALPSPSPEEGLEEERLALRTEGEYEI